MTPEEIIADRRLIAEFMESIPETIDLLMKYSDYARSWQWLMPVVEKIESIYHPDHGYFGVHIVSNTCTIQGTKFSPDKKQSLPYVYSSDHCAETKLLAAYDACICFIKWYNAVK